MKDQVIDGQIGLFEGDEESTGKSSHSLAVVKADFLAGESATWQELFEGYNEIRIITFRPG